MFRKYSLFVLLLAGFALVQPKQPVAGGGGLNAQQQTKKKAQPANCADVEVSLATDSDGITVRVAYSNRSSKCRGLAIPFSVPTPGYSPEFFRKTGPTGAIEATFNFGAQHRAALAAYYRDIVHYSFYMKAKAPMGQQGMGSITPRIAQRKLIFACAHERARQRGENVVLTDVRKDRLAAFLRFCKKTYPNHK